MLLRRQRSIFHLGEEGGAQAQHVKSVDCSGRNQLEGRQQEEGAVVGLRILVAQRRQHARGTTTPTRRHIVQKQMVLPTTTSEARRHRRGGGFLRACALCRRELSPDKDVYMYRGDQGFCSEECRRRQILTDEAREREAVIMKQRRGASSIRRHHAPWFAAASPANGAPRRFLAVA